MVQLTPAVNPTIDSSLSIQNESLATVESRLSFLKDFSMTGISAGDEEGSIQNIWLKGFGSSANQKKKNEIDGYRVKHGGVTVGYDKLIDELTVGYAISYARSQVDQKINHGTKTDIDTYQAMLYGSRDLKNNFFVDLFATGSIHKYSGKRSIVFGGINRTASTDYNGYQLSAKANVGRKVSISKKLEITPLASAQYTYLKQNAYDESGANAANLHVESKTSNRLQVGMGGKFGFPIKNNNKTTSKIVPYIQPMLLYDLTNSKQESTSNFIGNSASFKTSGLKPGRISGNINLGLDIHHNESYQISLNYSYTGKSKYSSHAGYVNFKYTF